MKRKTVIIFLLSMFLGGFQTGCWHNPSSQADISDLEMTPETMEIYTARQNNLLSQIENGIIIVNANTPGSAGNRHGPRVSVNYHYLTGLTEGECTMILSKNDTNRYSLFYPERGIGYIIYTGEPASKETLKKEYGIDQMLDFAGLNRMLEDNLKARLPVYIDFGDTRFKNIVTEMISKAGSDPALLKDIGPMISEMRIKKDDLEIKRLQKAVDITGEAFINVCKDCLPESYEFEMEAIIEYNFQKLGAAMPGFASIVGSGKNSTFLHYENNNKKMKPGELLLMDIGAEYGYYTADITRTIPVNGRFSKEQKEIYGLVLTAQKAAIEEMKPGKNITAGFYKANEIIVSGLHDLGLITDPEKEWQRMFYILYYPGHYLGLNVHDVGDYGCNTSELMENRANTSVSGRAFEKGMVLTIEPGIYFRENGLKQLKELFGNEVSEEEINAFVEKVAPVYEKYKNIGVRIEDDILITENGNINLSQNLPKEIKEIEKLMR
jgi:Xaa-Pro aminopeptidase